jgi:glycerol-3-phosphate dehydrogenase (NAD(P)+)
MSIGRIGVIGAGAWGTALANAAALAGRDVILWGRDADEIAAMAAMRENRKRLPGVPLHERVKPVASLAEAADSRALLLAVPAQNLRSVCEALSLTTKTGIPAIITAKGIERETGLFMSDVVRDTLPGAMPAVLSGPSFADDVARGLPTAVVLAAPDDHVAQILAHALSSPRFRVYHGTDVRGVEIGGAAKNVLAIAAGIVEGRGLGESAKAALTARGFAELQRFATAYGGKPETLMGLSGLGDLILTCGSLKSRNFAFGHDLGRGLSPAEAGQGKLAEGVFTAHVLVAMARARGIGVPVAEAVDAVLNGTMSVDKAVEALMTRPLKAE